MGSRKSSHQVNLQRWPRGWGDDLGSLGLGTWRGLTHFVTSSVTQAHAHPYHVAHVLAAVLPSRPQLRDAWGRGCPTQAAGALERQHVGLKREPSWCSSRARPMAKLRAAQPRGTGHLREYVPGSRPLCPEGSTPSRAWGIQSLKHYPGEPKPTLCSGSD